MLLQSATGSGTTHLRVTTLTPLLSHSRIPNIPAVFDVGQSCENQCTRAAVNTAG